MTTVVLTTEQILSRIEHIVPSKCIAWLGAGMSRPYYPGWIDLLKGLCTECGVQYPHSSPDLLQLADACRTTNAGKYAKKLEDTFRNLPPSDDVRYYTLFENGFLAYVTTNYDQLLETHIPHGKRIERFAYPDLPANKLRDNESTIFHLHGSILRPEGLAPKYSTDFLVLSKTDFDEAYGAGSLLPGFLMQLFRFHPILFMGCSLEESDIQRVLNSVETIFGNLKKFDNRICHHPKFFLAGRKNLTDSSGKHVGFDEIAEAQEVNRLKEFEIEVLRYDNHDILNEVLTGLKRKHTAKPTNALTATF